MNGKDAAASSPVLLDEAKSLQVGADHQNAVINCQYVYTPRDSDSLSVDSLGFGEMEQEIELDENGAPVVRQQEPEKAEQATPADGNNTEATEPKKKAQPEYEDVYF